MTTLQISLPKRKPGTPESIRSRSKAFNMPKLEVLVPSLEKSATTRWWGMDDEQFTKAVQNRVIDKNKVGNWDNLISKYPGIKFEIFKRNLRREEFNFDHKTVRVKEMDDDQFIEHVKAKNEEKGIRTWEQFISVCKGFAFEVFKRELPREALGFC